VRGFLLTSGQIAVKEELPCVFVQSLGANGARILEWEEQQQRGAQHTL
jgi:hypothetical protein